MSGAATEEAVLANCVLVVDNDPAARDLLTRFLEREGFTARSAGDGRAGLELARTLRPRAILLDVLMPGMDGWSVLSALKADPELASIPVVIETVAGERGLASATGAADYLAKPIEWNQLKRVLDRFFALCWAAMPLPSRRSICRRVGRRWPSQLASSLPARRSARSPMTSPF